MGNPKKTEENELHMVLTGDNRMLFATCDLKDINKAIDSTPGVRSFTNVDPLVVAQFTEGRLPSRVVKSDQAWQMLAPAMQTFAENIQVYDTDESTPTYWTTPVDLPPIAAEGRGDIIEQHPQIIDIPLAIELSEVVMAAKYRREADRALFREESLEANWQTASDLDPEILRDAFERTNNYLTIPDMNPLDFALKMQELKELKMLMDIAEPTETTSPSAG
ncbi:hypothetical protein AWH63_21315 [Marinobacter sp. C18]|uniref:hypothetical protein n=1 Tax=Marinobacter sp. C18 TaxID=1772288 RepID=UPI000948C2D0|nr:hypothetical protein [Marinobacter sp. C18]OLF83452.1 hypothetical protein AWH63_21315 [Marinobacter sp. C18]